MGAHVLSILSIGQGIRSEILLNMYEILRFLVRVKGPSKTLRDIRTSTYQICSIEEKTIRTTKFHK